MLDIPNDHSSAPGHGVPAQDDARTAARGTAVRVLVAHPAPATRRNISRMLDGATPFVVCAAVASVEGVRAAITQSSPDAFVIDTTIEGGGVVAAKAVIEANPGVPVVMTTVVESRVEMVDALLAGASAYLLRPLDRESLRGALLAALRGQVVVPRHLAPVLTKQPRPDRSVCR
jgi:two-component system, NarL family, nitrate/nitrite response regulator NarL